MKRKILISFIGIILLLIFFVLVICAYFLLVDIESNAPKELSNNYIETRKYKERKVFIINPKEDIKTDLKILYFHGGSYVAETSEEHWNFLLDLSNKTGATIILPDYPLTPKYNYKDVFQMVEPLYKEIVNNIGTKNLVMMGDSAGGGIALALSEKLGEEDFSQPQELILLSPWIDVTMENKEIEKVEKFDDELNKESLRLAGIAYAGKDGMESYLVNPINGPLKKLKNVTIYTGTYDILNLDVHVLAKKAKNEGIEINLKEYEKAKHIWIIKDNDSQGRKDLIEQLKSI